MIKLIRKPFFILASALTAGFLLRLWGITWGLPLKYAHIDESVVIFYSFRFFTGDLNPHVFFDYPTLFLYLIYAVEYIYFTIGSLFGYFTSLDQFAGKYFLGDITGIYLIARMVSVAAGTASIYLIYRISRLFYSEKVSLLAGILLCFNWLHILHSHYATVDVFALFMTLLCVYFICEYFATGKRISFLYSCLLLGLSTATKYYPLVFFANVLLIPLLKKENFSKQLVYLYFSGLALVIFGFFIGCPYAFLDFGAFSARFTTIFTNVVKPEHFSLLKNITTLVTHIFNGTGAVLFLAGLATIFFALQAAADFFILSFIIVFFLFSLGFKAPGTHYLFPLYPFIFILTAKGFENISKKVHYSVFYTAAFLFVLVSMPKIINIDYTLMQKDTRLIAYDWVLQNIPKKSKILRFPYTPEFKPADGYSVKVDWDYKIPASTYKDYNYIITSNKNDKLENNFQLIKSFTGTKLSGFHNPDIDIYQNKH